MKFVVVEPSDEFDGRAFFFFFFISTRLKMLSKVDITAVDGIQWKREHISSWPHYEIHHETIISAPTLVDLDFLFIIFIFFKFS